MHSILPVFWVSHVYIFELHVFVRFLNQSVCMKSTHMFKGFIVFALNKQTALHEVLFDTLSNNAWATRYAAITRFVQAVRKVRAPLTLDSLCTNNSTLYLPKFYD